MCKMRNAHCRNWNMVINVGNEKKMRNSQGRSWNMARNIENVENEKHTLQNPEYRKKTEKRGKEDTHTHTVGPGIWQEK